jgi:hypothetical protein
MKPSHHTSPAGTETTFTQIWTWAQELDPLLTRIAPRFVRSEPRRRALACLRGILSDTSRMCTSRKVSTLPARSSSVWTYASVAKLPHSSCHVTSSSKGPLTIVVGMAGRSPPHNAAATTVLSFRYHAIFCFLH